MKKLLLILTAVLLPLSGLQAQTVFMATDQTEICIYNESSEAFENCQTLAEPSLFALSQGETVFRHTTEQMSSAYRVKSRQYNVDDKSWQYAVVSDVGNSYVFIVMPQTCIIKIVGTREDEQGKKEYYIIAHHISKTWKEEEQSVGLTRQ